ncbi:MAG TPA: ABC transporter substrate-binding protein [Allosphingosinicella sp.]
MTPFRTFLCAGLAAFALCLAGCGEESTGPIAVSAIGGPPVLANPNLQPLDPPAAYLTEAVAQGLVRFDAAGEIEPALAQSWIVSDDGLRYTFRLRRIDWAGGGRVTAQQVVARLRAALSRASRNPLKPVLGAVDDVIAMTDEVLEISLRGPRPNFLQLLAHPEMAIIQSSAGTGPYRLARAERGEMRLEPLRGEDEEAGMALPDIALRGERAASAVARFQAGRTDLVIGGTIGDLPIVRAAEPPAASLAFDPAGGLFGLVFTARDGPLADPAVRRAMAMAVDRQTLAALVELPRLGPRTSLVAPGVQEYAVPVQPDWAATSLPDRRAAAARAISEAGGASPPPAQGQGPASPQAEAPSATAPAERTPLRVRVAIPDGPGYRLVFAALRADWRAIGIDAVRVRANEAADLRLIDEVAPANLASWYLRHFTCDLSTVCDEKADQALLAARLAPRPADRQAQFAVADRILTGLTPFIPLTAPVRWSLVSRRLTGFRPNSFARHPAVNLIAESQ